jgi:curved DNA-binding protein CbpA
MDDGSDPYDVLGISRQASTSDIRKAWLALSKKYHPDKAKTEEEIRRNTIMMFKVNEAYELLFDEAKRREYDEGVSDDDEDSVDKGPSGRAYNEQNYEEAPKAKPDHLGRPYEGPDKSTSFYYACEGADGADAIDGRSGFSGSYPGGDGMDGGDAGPATPGSRGLDLKIFMKTTVSSSGYFQVNVYATSGHGEVMDPTRRTTTQVPLKSFLGADFTAAGGSGGNGGFGGSGGDGAKGYRGRDATRWSSGTNGGPGGDGGSGGRGSNGADGGDAGNVDIMIDYVDIYLLMRVDASDPRKGVGNRVSGGRGGNPGQHGVGGRGGRGGAGGSSCEWEETICGYRDGRQEATIIKHSNPGGWRGPSGRNGYTPSYPLIRGNDGSDGRFRILVDFSQGRVVSYSRRYDLTFQDSITNHLSDMPGRKTFEFGETVVVSACIVRNTGYMPMPCQRTMIGFEDAQGVVASMGDYLFLERNTDLRPGGEKEASQGHLRYLCPFPRSLGTDYDPIHKQGIIRYIAHQLGPENDTTDKSLISDFQVKYIHFHDPPEHVSMAFPVENKAGILGIHSLGSRETTMLRLKLNNISNQSLGRNSRGGRALFVQLYYADDKEYEIPLHVVTVRGDEGKILNIGPRHLGHRKEILILPRRSDTTIQLTFKFDDNQMRPCATAGLQADIFLQEIPTLHVDGTFEEHTKMRLVQRRLFIASHQPKFIECAESDVVLVTTTASAANQVSAWESLISERLGLRPKVYSLSRYGHIDATKATENKKLLESFSGNLVILLNEQFYAQPNVESQRKNTYFPSQLMNSTFDFKESTRFLVVGGRADAVEHMSPKASCINAIEAKKMIGTAILKKQNCKTFRDEIRGFIETERAEGFAKDRVAPSCEVIQVKTRTLLRTPKKARAEKIVSARSEKLQAFLAQQDKLRNYRVEWEARGAPQAVEVNGGWRRKCWNIGEFRVYVGSPRFQNSMVLLEEESCDGRTILSSPKAIHNISTVYATISALPFETKIKCYCRSMRALSVSSSTNHDEVCTAVRYSLVSDFLWDASNYYQGRMRVQNPSDRSPTIRSLLSNERFWELINESVSRDAVELKKVVKKEVSMLLAGLQSVAESKDLAPWWSPLSRKHRARRSMQETFKVLNHRLSCLIDKEVITAERKLIDEEAKHYVKVTRGKFWLRATGRWREALAVVHSPSSPRQFGKSLSMVRTRREAEFDIGASHKVKKLSAQAVSPEEAFTTRQILRKRLEASHNIRKTTKTERVLYIQT